MKENSDGNDTNVGSIGNSIEEEIETLEELRTHGYAMLLMKYEDRIKTNRKIDQALEHIVSDYKKVLKENEILKEEKEQAWEEWNNLEQGSYETEQKLKQQIKESQKENEELRAKWDKDTHILQNKLDYANADRIDLAQQNKELRKENEGLKIKNNAIKRESEAYAENMIRLDNELNLEKEKSKYEWIRQNCLPQELVNKLYIPIQKVKDKIEEEKLPLVIVGGRRNKRTLEYGIKLGRRQALQELLGSEE